MSFRSATALLFLLSFSIQGADKLDQPERGYFRFPAIHGETVVFTAEGDLWKGTINGGVAERLTTHPATESRAAISPDGKMIAFSAEYEGPTEVYTMPITGGVPVRRTYGSEAAWVVGWTPDGKVIYATSRFSTLPNTQLATIDLHTGARSILPLAQASEGAFSENEKEFYFTRLPFQGSSTKRYKGGTAQNLWKFTDGAAEAIPLTPNYPGISRNPMWWKDRLYFISDDGGIMNIWSMKGDGSDRRQLTMHHNWDVKNASLSEGRIVYSIGADLRLFEIETGKNTALHFRLPSDYDQQRDKWIKRPIEYLTSAHISTNGDRVVLTARGQVFVAPAKDGRLVEVTRNPSIRYRQARFIGKDKLIALNDETGELEFCKLPSNGVGVPEQVTTNATGFRYDGIPSPNEKWLAYTDKDYRLLIWDFKKKKEIVAGTSNFSEYENLTWSPDGEWLAYARTADNLYRQVWLYRPSDGKKVAVTSERVDSYSPAWSPDGKWLYFLSDREIRSVVGSPWGPRQPEPFFDQITKIYQVALQKDLRSPFQPDDELYDPNKKKEEKKEDKAKDKEEKEKKKEKDEKEQPEKKDPEKEKKEKKDFSDEVLTSSFDDASTTPDGALVKIKGKEEPKKEETASEEKKPEAKKEEKKDSKLVKIDLDGLASRVQEVPVPAGNYDGLSVISKHLLWIARDNSFGARPRLQQLEITNDDPKPKTIIDDLRSYEISADGKKMLVHRGDNLYIQNADAGKLEEDKRVNLNGWSFVINPRDEWRQMFTESWRLMRDYFYDRNMHGVPWKETLQKYLPLVDRVTDRSELSDLMADMMGELSALHIFVSGGDMRGSPDRIPVASLGAEFKRDETAGGWKITHIYQADPDYPSEQSPLKAPGLDFKKDDTFLAFNGVSLLSVAHPEMLLRNQVNKQVLVDYLDSETGEKRQAIVKPHSGSSDADLRYDEWEYTRRLKVDELSDEKIGYVHLRAMGSANIAEWARDFYPVFQRDGLIIDVRHNRGGNIDSWILEKLLRKAWFYFQGRAGKQTWNMQYAFRGHVVVLCNEFTASDGEAFSEGFKRLGLGKVIGTRTWGGEIWLSFSNRLVDQGIASAAEIGVYGPEGHWLIEGHGVEPDITVDNLPHETFNGKDAQLEAAVKHLQEQIKNDPRPVPPVPTYPNKYFKFQDEKKPGAANKSAGGNGE